MKKPTASEVLLGNIIGRMKTYRISPEYLAAGMAMTPRTLYRRMKCPETFCMSEIEGAARVLKTTVTALMQIEES